MWICTLHCVVKCKQSLSHTATYTAVAAVLSKSELLGTLAPTCRTLKLHGPLEMRQAMHTAAMNRTQYQGTSVYIPTTTGSLTLTLR